MSNSTHNKTKWATIRRRYENRITDVVKRERLVVTAAFATAIAEGKSRAEAVQFALDQLGTLDRTQRRD